MVGLGKKLVLGSALAASTLVAVTPAEAQRWRGRNRGGDVATGAIIGGIVGLGLGAAIANSNNRWDRGWRGRGGWDPRWDGRGWNRGWGGPGWNGGGWNGAWGGPGWNGGGWGGPGWNNFGPRCFIVRDWDPYWGAPVNRRVCR